jgi:hypothetical protein
LIFKTFFTSFLITSLSPEISIPMARCVPFSLSRIIMSGLFLTMVCQFSFIDVILLPIHELRGVPLYPNIKKVLLSTLSTMLL